MAASLALKRATAGNLFNKLLNPFRSVSSTPCVARCFSTDASQSQVTAYKDDNRSVDVDRRPGSSVSRRDQDSFTDLFDPFSPTRSLSQILNMMDQFMGNPFSLTREGIGGIGPRRGWDVKEDNESLRLRLDMPGIDKDDVKISVEQNTLIIRGEGKKVSEQEEEPPRRYFSRIDLPPNIYKLDEIKAELKNGVLKLRIPKVKEEERKDVKHVPIE